MTKRSTTFWQTIALMALLVSIAAAVQTGQNAIAWQVDVVHSKWLFVFMAIISWSMGALVFLVVARQPLGQKVMDAANRLAHLPPAWRILGVVGFILLLPVYACIVSRPFYAQYLDGKWMGAFLCSVLWLGGMVFLKLGRRDLSWRAALGGAIVAQTVTYSIVISLLLVNNNPFSQDWSEFSRYYGASLYYSERFYGMRLPLPILNPAYHLMLTVPFWFGIPPIWVHRLWEILLQIGLTAGLGLLFSKRLKFQESALTWFVAGWAFLFLMQGPIQPSLLMCALISLAGVAPGKFRRTTIMVVLASLWAGWCRINWFPFPAAWAAIAYFMEVPVPASRRWPAYLRKPALWLVLGTVVAFGSNILYMIISGNGLRGNFTASLASDLLWYRLLPNPTNPHGILPDLLLVSAAPILMIVLALYKRGGRFHSLQLTGIFAALAVFLVGGLVVSVKIGGGADLHNLDAFLILLMAVSGHLYSGRAALETSSRKFPFLEAIILPILVILIPAWMVIRETFSIRAWDRGQETLAIQAIHLATEEIDSQEGEVLFISQRHLIVFQDLDVSLVPEYDQVTIMEMVMSHHRPYLNAFHDDLSAQRFSLIILDPQEIQHYGRTRAFGEENDLWVQEVSIPLLCYYRPAVEFPEFRITLYVPLEQPCE